MRPKTACGGVWACVYLTFCARGFRPCTVAEGGRSHAGAVYYTQRVKQAFAVSSASADGLASLLRRGAPSGE